MGLLSNMIKNGISQGIGNALEKAVSNVVEEKVKPVANKVANAMADDATRTLNAAKELSSENADAIEDAKNAINEIKQMANDMNDMEDKKFIENWPKHEVLGKFPTWNVGGNEYSLDENKDDCGIYYHLNINSINNDQVDSYINTLTQNGFTKSSEYQYDKQIDGNTYSFSTYDSYVDDNVRNLAFWINYNK